MTEVRARGMPASASRRRQSAATKAREIDIGPSLLIIRLNGGRGFIEEEIGGEDLVGVGDRHRDGV